MNNFNFRKQTSEVSSFIIYEMRMDCKTASVDHFLNELKHLGYHSLIELANFMFIYDRKKHCEMGPSNISSSIKVDIALPKYYSLTQTK